MRYFLLIIFCLLAANISKSYANWPDIQRQFPQIQLQELETATTRLQVLKLPSQSSPQRGTILLMPATGRHPYSPDWFNSLLQLSLEGWQLVFLPAPEPLPESAQRHTMQQTQLIARWQAVQQLVERPLIVIAQGEVAGMLNLVQESTNPIDMDALITLGVYLSDPDSHMRLQQKMAQIQLPVLDILTRSDHPWSMASASQRQQLARNVNNAFYRQRVLDDFSGHASQQSWLQREITGWLRTSGF